MDLQPHAGEPHKYARAEWSKLFLQFRSSKYVTVFANRSTKVQEVAVFGAHSDKWGERPVALLVPKEEFKAEISEDELKEHMTQSVEDGKILKWWIPDRFVFVDQIPRTSVGKFDKKVMRSGYGDVLGRKE